MWTDLYLAVERLIEGDRRDRMKADAGPWTLEKITHKTLKHTLAADRVVDRRAWVL